MRSQSILVAGLLVSLFCFSTVRLDYIEVESPIGFPVHNLNTGLNYATIQEAIDAPETSDGHTIFADAGIYYEYIRIDKSIVLIGENKSTTIIDGNGTFRDIVRITANDTIMKGFTVKNTDWFGIYVWASTNVTIEDNNIIEASYGIRLDMSSKSRVARNVVENNSFIGILLCDSTNNTLKDNCMANNTENFGVWGVSLADFVNDVDETNIVDGKPICYLVNEHNKQINADAGLVVAVNCTNITAKNLNVTNNDQGIMFAFTNSSRIEANIISQCTSGIDFYNSFNNTIVSNFVSNNSRGISSRWSYDSCFFNNTSTSNGNGIYLYSSDRNMIASNEFSYNYGDYGIDFHESSNNLFYHNNIFKNKKSFCPYSSGHNVWDNGYPSGGNYWSDYTGIDHDQGSGQNISGSDGIGDTEYSIDANNADHYPLMGMFNNYDVIYYTLPFVPHHCNVTVISNSTISNFVAPIWIEHPEVIFLQFNVSGADDSTGFCRVSFPTAMMNGTYHVFVNHNEIPCTLLLCSDANHSYLYFTYTHSTQEVMIVPEFPSLLVLPLFMISTMLAVIAHRRKHLRSIVDQYMQELC